ncbi:MAG: DMT family transporter [Acetobacteraceae bacterium]|nr:DMT family transporter [Acetobacteraceae bacterium]
MKGLSVCPPKRCSPEMTIVPRALLRDDAQETLRGILFVNIAYLAMTLGDVAGKYALFHIGVAELMIWRGVFGSGAILSLASAQRGRMGWRMVIPVRRGMVFARALLSCFVSMTWFAAWTTMSLADTYAIGFTAPLIMTVMAIPLLAEKIYWQRLVATVVGFGGVLVMLHPEGELWQPGVPLLLLGIVGMAYSRIMTRQLAATETPACQAFWITAVHIPFGIAIWPLYPSLGTFNILALAAVVFLGVINSMGHWIFARGYALAPVSALAPYEYTMLLWGGVLGYLIWGDAPAWTTLVGAVVIVAAGLYTLRYEHRRRPVA